MTEPIKLDEQQRKAYDAILAGENVFVTGVAGTGKSTLLNEVKNKKEMAITATTGIAAVNVGGATLHSYFGVGLAREDADTLLAEMFAPAKKRIKRTKTLVIDEVSMLSAELFEKLEYIARKIKGKHDFFGGIQLVFFGDFLQLPPVTKNKEPDFCFESPTWFNAMFNIVELKHVYRQENREFVDILAKIRKGELDEAGEARLLECKYSPEKHPPEITPVVLFSTNDEARKRNTQKLAEIEKKPVFFEATQSGNERKAENLMNNCRADRQLELKVGAQVMMMINKHQDKNVVNGSIGTVEGFEGGLPVVNFHDAGVKLTIDKHRWEATEYDPETLEKMVVATVSQIPLHLAWAITIHKSQGMTIPWLYCDLRRVFCDSQIYVAVSRAKSLDGLFLEGFSREKITVNEKALSFYQNLK